MIYFKELVTVDVLIDNMLGKIHLKNIRIFSNHGCLDEEKIIGSDYLVNLKIKADLKKAIDSDELSDTVDYVHLNRIISEEMHKRSKLLEHVAYRALKRIFDELPQVQQVSIGIAKVNPPIGGDVASVAVKIKQKRVCICE
ncbi:Dihydroneopterin aldolase [Capnocytophaga canimorsus]|uniref:7,8-dihydroneopterin aldolase n=2 Tax=Capnocytophaga canimorsus TaxID=28188 RepID=A0A0B7HAA0_9FLAO|nr:dihydroneopterin aldolase [Capnocytophaga canimorsus]CEN36220.1 Dihydroneopterin aldolase [Capnocytophaga canimorsus]STA72678.1 Dihydroneopterin aldolase [Capnocytophaga canimorsus]